MKSCNSLNKSIFPHVTLPLNKLEATINYRSEMTVLSSQRRLSPANSTAGYGGKLKG